MSKTHILVLFFSIIFVNLRATETETDPLKADSDDETSQAAEAVAREVKKAAEKPSVLLRFPSLLQPPVTGRAQGNLYGKMPLRYSMLFERTVYIETFFFCIVVLYGILHLPIWVTLYEKLKRQIESNKTGPIKDEEQEMEME